MRPYAQDPATLTPQDRLREIATILAQGYIRLRVSRQSATEAVKSPAKGLDQNPESRPSCPSMGTTPESPEEAA